MLVDLDPDKEIEIGVDLQLDKFSVCLVIEENLNRFSKIKFSTDRTYEITGSPSKHTGEIAYVAIDKFEELASVCI